MQYPDRPSQAFRIQTLAPAMIALLVLASLQPLVVITTVVMPFQFSEPSWRVRVFGLLLGATPQLSLCLVVIAAVGLFSQHYRAVRGAAVAALVLGLLLIPTLIMDGLDSVQVQQMVSLDRLRAYRINALQTWVMAALLVPVLLWVGQRGLLAGRKDPGIGIEDALLLTDQPVGGPLDPRVTN